MPVAYEFEESGVVLVRCSGAVTYEECLAAQNGMASDPRMTGSADMLVECGSVSSVPSAPELRKLAQNLRPMLDRGLGRIAIASHALFPYGVARMFAVFAEAVNADVAAFRSEDAARDWLTGEKAA